MGVGFLDLRITGMEADQCSKGCSILVTQLCDGYGKAGKAENLKS